MNMMGGKTGSPAEAGVMALLALVTDPAAASARLAAIQAAQLAADEAAKAAGDAQAKADATQKAAEELQNTVNAALEGAAARAKQLQGEAARLQDMDLALTAREAMMNDRVTAVTASAASIAEREAVVVVRERELSVAEEGVSMLKGEYEGKLAELKAAAQKFGG
jgi:uncharacterized protein (DUF3084 family)